MTLRNVGRVWLGAGKWHVTAQPHVVAMLKRVFPRLKCKTGTFEISDSPANAADLFWFLQRFPMDVQPRDRLERQREAYLKTQAELQFIDSADYVPREFALALPLRRYQAQAADMMLATKAMLLGDDVGLGKTATSIGVLAYPGTLPALIVTYGHLQQQWVREINRFLPGAKVHIIKQTKHYDTRTGGRAPDVYVITYTKLADWHHYLAGVCKTVIYDEIQELRREKSAKYQAAQHLARMLPYRFGLSATPIYNQGGETFNVFDVLKPDCLGGREEFAMEWCCGGTGEDSGKWVVKDPKALGAYLRSEHLMLRRTREEVGRQLPAVSRHTQIVDYNEAALDKIKGLAGELARSILTNVKHARGQDMQESAEFVNLLRQQTGIAKAPAVAAFVQLLLEQDEPVILGGWHRAVYDIWRDALKDHNPVFYTGTETINQKAAARDQFLEGKTNLMVLSLRSGVGLDGLQARCRNVVFGELDWSPGPHKQFIGRVHRDGQTQNTFAYFCACNSGSDPVMMETLGLKDSQARGINDPWAEGAEVIDNAAEKRARKLALHYLGMRDEDEPL